MSDNNTHRNFFLRRRREEDSVTEKDRDAVEESIRNHALRTRQRRENFYRHFTVDTQKMLESVFLNWPTTSDGNPLPGMRAKFMKVLRLDHRQPESHNLCDLWMESVGWSILGRNCYTDGRGVIWGPSPIEGISHKFPYSRAFYDKVRDCWNLEPDDDLYEVFFGKKEASSQ